MTLDETSTTVFHEVVTIFIAAATTVHVTDSTVLGAIETDIVDEVLTVVRPITTTTTLNKRSPSPSSGNSCPQPEAPHCLDAPHYRSACSCIGARTSTVTASLPTRTVTVQVTKGTSTVHETAIAGTKSIIVYTCTVTSFVVDTTVGKSITVSTKTKSTTDATSIITTTDSTATVTTTLSTEIDATTISTETDFTTDTTVYVTTSTSTDVDIDTVTTAYTTTGTQINYVTDATTDVISAVATETVTIPQSSAVTCDGPYPTFALQISSPGTSDDGKYLVSFSAASGNNPVYVTTSGGDAGIFTLVGGVLTNSYGQQLQRTNAGDDFD
jgi:hypothetical protein